VGEHRIDSNRILSRTKEKTDSGRFEQGSENKDRRSSKNGGMRKGGSHVECRNLFTRENRLQLKIELQLKEDLKMIKTLFVLSLIAMGALIYGSCGEAQMQQEHQHDEKIEQAQGDEVVCPVTNRIMKRAESPTSYTLYFASEAAKDAFLNNPAKFLTATCPVMGGEANKLTAAYSDNDGVAYFHCCAGCKETFQKEPKKYIGKTHSKPESQSKADVKTEGPFCGASMSGCSKACLEKGLSGHSCALSQTSDVPGNSATMAGGEVGTDPVCGMTVSSKDGVHSEFHGEEYYFCSTQCQEKFEKAPEEYIKR
jgi:YHS domain-containing protein